MLTTHLELKYSLQARTIKPKSVFLVPKKHKPLHSPLILQLPSNIQFGFPLLFIIRKDITSYSITQTKEWLDPTVFIRVDSEFATKTKTSASRQNLSIQVSSSVVTSVPGLMGINKNYILHIYIYVHMYFFIWPCCTACRIWNPSSLIRNRTHTPHAEAQILNQWASKKSLYILFFFFHLFLLVGG